MFRALITARRSGEHHSRARLVRTLALAVVGLGVGAGSAGASATKPVTPPKAASAKAHAKAHAKPVASAGEAGCYSQADFEAEQGIRLHTDLMVAGLTCQRFDPSKPFFDQYNTFTHTHRAAIMMWESQLIGHYRQLHHGDPTRVFDTLRTDIANESARRAQLMTTPVFCDEQGAFVAEAMKLTPETLHQRISDVGQLPLAKEKLCKPMAGDLPVLQPAKAMPLPVLAPATLKVAAAK
ncbi:MAG: hypothetical protein P4M00_00990 [Azospirillaceae bacterium]|nr:hypothetical protein [Azospirillaceae bacterium]